MEIVGKISEGLAAAVGQLHPVLDLFESFFAEIVKNPDEDLTEQFNLVNQKLEGIQDEHDTMDLELQRSTMNMQNFDYEVQILNQYERFQDFVNDPHNKKKREKFLSYYEKKNTDFHLGCLYNAITGKTDSEGPMFEKRAIIEQRNRRAVEYFCGTVMKIFLKGIIVVVCYAIQKDRERGDNELKKWQKRMEDVKKHVNAAVDECTERFAVQAELDMERELQKKPGSVDLDFTKSLLDFLVKKYDWVKWSIRVFNDRERTFFFNWFAEKTYHGCAGGVNCFDVLTNSNIKVVVSFCVDPKPFDKSQIQQKIEKQKLKGDMKLVAQSLRRSFPSCLVHAVSRKEVVETNNFPEDCYYYGKHNGIYLCIHPVMPHTA
ncbi:protein rapunzel-like [Centroberyx gerrardi]